MAGRASRASGEGHRDAEGADRQPELRGVLRRGGRHACLPAEGGRRASARRFATRPSPSSALRRPSSSPSPMRPPNCARPPRGVRVLTAGAPPAPATNRRRWQRGPSRRPDIGRDRRARQCRHVPVLQRSGGHGAGDARRVLPYRRRRGGAPGRLRGDPRPHQGRDHPSGSRRSRSSSLDPGSTSLSRNSPPRFQRPFAGAGLRSRGVASFTYLSNQPIIS